MALSVCLFVLVLITKITIQVGKQITLKIFLCKFINWFFFAYANRLNHLTHIPYISKFEHLWSLQTFGSCVGLWTINIFFYFWNRNSYISGGHRRVQLRVRQLYPKFVYYTLSSLHFISYLTTNREKRNGNRNRRELISK